MSTQTPTTSFRGSTEPAELPIAAPESLDERTLPGLHGFIASHLSRRFGNRHLDILDLGCGTGAWLKRMHDLGHRNLFGVDLGPPTLEWAITRKASLNQSNYGLADRQFDLITAIEVVEHVPNLQTLFEEASKHLKPDGCLILTTPNISSLTARLRFLITGRLAQFDDYGDPTHYVPVYIPALARLLRQFGLHIEETFSYPVKDWGIGSGRLLIWASKILGAFLPNPLQGDVVILVIKHA